MKIKDKPDEGKTPQFSIITNTARIIEPTEDLAVIHLDLGGNVLRFPKRKSKERPDYKDAAIKAWELGFHNLLPTIQDTKRPAVKWSFAEGQTLQKIIDHWTKYPDHELGWIVGESYIVFDADTPEAEAALCHLEKTFDVTPYLTVRTKKGVHHYFRRAPGTYAKSDSHSSEKYPERIDIKTGRALVILPPSTGKEFEILEVENLEELSEVDQEFIDAVYRHNGRDAPRPVEKKPITRVNTDLIGNAQRLKSLLDLLDPDMGYEDWIHVGMALYFETGGDEVGLQLFDEWSSKGEKYADFEAISYKYESFSNHTGPSITIATLIKMVRDQGHEWIDPGVEQFERCETVVIKPDEDSSPAAPLPLDKFSLRGKLPQLEKLCIEQVPILDGTALSGQATVIYAAPNTGKTLLTIDQLTDAIRRGVIDPAKVYYINVDDTLSGLLTKLELAEEHGFHMLSEGYQGFSAAEFLETLHEMTIGEQANSVVIILDTLKKFTDLMDKRKASTFSKYIRRFVLQGGTVIALAHTNKNPGPDGKPRYSGTTDIVDDFDCAYTLAEVSTSQETLEKVVEFVNFKRRGNVVRQVAYSYSIEDGLSYDELLLSVKKVDDTALVAVKKAEELKSDAEVITTLTACIRNGINTKMRLADATAERAGTSRRNALKVIEKYTGSDPANHKWCYTVSERGAKVYSLLEEQNDD